jgi:precorrin-6Y C5,15-methyltransferase (decarboxylating)
MKFYVIGIDDNRGKLSLSPNVEKIVASHRVFSGGVRHHEIVRDFLPAGHHWVNILIPLEKVFEQYRAFDEVVVFASGDPLFFGFANTIQRIMPEAELEIFPYFNSLQLLAHRLRKPYHDMQVVSLTGRPWHKFDEYLICGAKLIGILTDNKQHTPSEIAKRMLEYGYDNYRMHIGELLGNDEKEVVSTWNLQDVVGKEFQFPNNLMLEKTEPRLRPFGIPEGNFHLLSGRDKMITKMPIRLISLSLLDLRDKNVFWDVGFCTGSVSVEAKMQFPHLLVYSFEQRSEGLELMENNARKFGAPGISTYMGDFLETDISPLPKPDAVFIGGHGGKLVEIVSKIAEVLTEGGFIVFNSVSDESRNLFLNAIGKCNLGLKQSMRIQVDEFNPIDVMKAGI